MQVQAIRDALAALASSRSSRKRKTREQVNHSSHSRQENFNVGMLNGPVDDVNGDEERRKFQRSLNNSLPRHDTTPGSLRTGTLSRGTSSNSPPDAVHVFSALGTASSIARLSPEEILVASLAPLTAGRWCSHEELVAVATALNGLSFSAAAITWMGLGQSTLGQGGITSGPPLAVSVNRKVFWMAMEAIEWIVNNPAVTSGTNRCLFEAALALIVALHAPLPDGYKKSRAAARRLLITLWNNRDGDRRVEIASCVFKTIGTVVHAHGKALVHSLFTIVDALATQIDGRDQALILSMTAGGALSGLPTCKPGAAVGSRLLSTLNQASGAGSEVCDLVQESFLRALLEAAVVAAEQAAAQSASINVPNTPEHVLDWTEYPSVIAATNNSTRKRSHLGSLQYISATLGPLFSQSVIARLMAELSSSPDNFSVHAKDALDSIRDALMTQADDEDLSEERGSKRRMDFGPSQEDEEEYRPHKRSMHSHHSLNTLY